MTPGIPEPALAKNTNSQDLYLQSGSRIAVIGGGPAGSFFSYFLLDMAERMGLDLQVDIFDPKSFDQRGPPGCNMCGGIISETLVQNLALEGILLPPNVVQRGIDSYTLHMDVGSVRIDTPLQEKRIAVVHRGGGPRGDKENRWDSFDAYLLSLAVGKGSTHYRHRVESIRFVDDRPQVTLPDGTEGTYDLLVVAVGVNGAAIQLLEQFATPYTSPATTKTFIREFFLGFDVTERTLGNSMQIFLLPIPRLEFAALIPKGDYISMCLLGASVDSALVDRFLKSPEVQRCMPAEWVASEAACKCGPRINIQGSRQPFLDRVVFTGDAGVTRLYKDGIGAAYRSAKAAATTAIFEGISAEAFRRVYEPQCRRMATDNAIGRRIFSMVTFVQRSRLLRSAILRMVTDEQQREGRKRRLSGMLWDLFTGSTPYRDIVIRAIHPGFWLGFASATLLSLLSRRPSTSMPDVVESQS